MKKPIITMLVTLVVMLACPAAHADEYAHDASVLPPAAQSILKKDFGSKVSVVKIDKTLGKVKEYEVVLMDGTEVSFDRAGNFKSVEVNRSQSVPKSVVNKNVARFVKDRHSGTNIVSYEVDRRGIEVELSNGIDIRFDKQGNFVRYED